MKTTTIILAGTIAALSISILAAPRSAAVFKGDRLVRPEGYREWMFLGSSLGLSYLQDPNMPNAGATLYHDVYIEPRAYREFVQTGRFRRGR